MSTSTVEVAVPASAQETSQARPIDTPMFWGRFVSSTITGEEGTTSQPGTENVNVVSTRTALAGPRFRRLAVTRTRKLSPGRALSGARTLTSSTTTSAWSAGVGVDVGVGVGVEAGEGVGVGVGVGAGVGVGEGVGAGVGVGVGGSSVGVDVGSGVGVADEGPGGGSSQPRAARFW